jgi:hypothetical protein
MDQSLLLLLLGKDSPWLPWILLASFLFSKIDEIKGFLHRWCFAWRAEYELSGTFYIEKRFAGQSGSFSKELQAILYYLHRNKSSLHISHARVISTEGLSLNGLCESIACPGDTYGVYLTPQIYARFHYTESTSSGRDTLHTDKIVNVHEVKVDVRLTTWKDQDTIHQFIQSLVVVLEDAQTANNEKLYVVKPSLVMDDSSSSYCTKYIPFNTSKTFDSLFFDDKDLLLKRLQAFQEKEGLAKRLGLPSTLGLLLYGEPGTGKTSAIKAIANHLRMSLIVVPMNKIKTRHDLEAVFYDKNVCYIDYSKRIYVLEEVDCNGWEKIVCPRSKTSEDWDTGVLDDLSNCSDPAVGKRALAMIQQKKRAEEDKLTLGAILEVLDGIVEVPGRIVIMTTNHRCALDPALIRPGRIDMQIEFRRLSRDQVAQIVEKAFSQAVPCASRTQLPDRKLTQAEVAQILWNNKDYSECLKALAAICE